MFDSIELGNLKSNSIERKKFKLKTNKRFNNDSYFEFKKSPKEFHNDLEKFSSEKTVEIQKNSALKTNVSKKNDSKNYYQQPNISFLASRLFDVASIELDPNLKRISVKAKHEEIFSNVKFSGLGLNPLLVSCLQQRFNLTDATKVQSIAIPSLLKGKDALIKSVTGSGKTLAYLIPMVNQLQALIPKIDRTHGLQSIVILPTRELALQTFNCLDLLLQPFRRIVGSILVGGEKKKSEKARIRKGVNILMTTPGRLLDHINHTKNLRLDSLKWLVIDEADRLYEQGFSAVIGEIIEHIQKSFLLGQKVQTVLLSATLTEGVKELSGLSLHQPDVIEVVENASEENVPYQSRFDNITLPATLKNCYVVVPPKLRLVILSSIIIELLTRKQDSTKAMIFFSCQDVVDFYSLLFEKIFKKFFSENEEIEFLKLHGEMNQKSRTEIYRKFHAAKHIRTVLFCTDVASRGLDLLNVDLIVQMSAPAMIEDYVHRAGRTARLGKQGQSILMVMPNEIKYIQYLQEKLELNFESLKMENFFEKINVLNLDEVSKHSLNTNQERLAFLQNVYENIVTEDLHELAVKAYLSYLRAYATYPRKLSYYYLPFKELHLGHLAKSFGLVESPRAISSKIQSNRKLLAKKKRKITDISSLKRKHVPLEDKFSEFGSGLTVKKPKIKRQKI